MPLGIKHNFLNGKLQRKWFAKTKVNLRFF